MGTICNFDVNRFECMQDEEVVTFARKGDDKAAEFLVGRYRPLVESKARAYFVVGADHDDVVQEGMIGLVKAIRDFRTDRLTRFRQFAELCVTRQIISAVKTATRLKHVPLNRYVSLNQGPSGEAGESPMIDAIADSSAIEPGPHGYAPRRKESLNELASGCLSDLERAVLRCYLEGQSYKEMSDQIGCHTKSIDNALQRVKRKIGHLLAD